MGLTQQRKQKALTLPHSSACHYGKYIYMQITLQNKMIQIAW